jgi:hypothetical protein
MKNAADPREAHISRQFVEDLLTSFLTGALGFELLVNIEDLEKLPASYQLRLQPGVDAKLAWVAWHTNVGIVAATGCYDLDQSRRSSAHVLIIEWWISRDTHHRSWWRANLQQPTEWTAGRG